MSPREGPGSAMTSRVVDGPLDPAGLARGTEDSASGALVVVTGARGGTDPAADDDGAGGEDGDESRPVGEDAGAEALDRSLDSIEDGALDRFDVRRCRLRVRADAPRGEPAVAAMVRAPHRGPAFGAARWAVASALGRVFGAAADAGAGAPGRPTTPDGRPEDGAGPGAGGDGTAGRGGP